jgi:hypothetical protein
MNDEHEVYVAIGSFIFWFSKLEGIMKSDLAGLLDLENDYLDPVVSAFDFAQLCNVLKAMKSKRAPKEAKSKIVEFFKECLKVNDERIRVVHGDWTLSGVRVISRGSRKAEIYFSEPKELIKWSARCETLATGYNVLMQ